MIERVLNLKFNDEDGGSFNFSIKDVKEVVEDIFISAAMDTIITNNIFVSKGGELVSKGEAQIVVKETTDVVL